MPANPPPNRYYRGPTSDHFDGSRFLVPGVAVERRSGDLLRLYLTPFAKWPERVAHLPAPRPSRRVWGESLRVTSIGHASHLIQTRGLNILVDPVWSERASPFAFVGPKRVTAPGLALDDLPHLEAVLVTHNHYDHLDLETLEALRVQRPCRLIVPLGNDAIIRHANPKAFVEAYDWGDRVPLSDDVAVTLVPCFHWSARWLGDRSMALWAAFVFETPDGCIYYIGDTAYRDGRFFRDIPTRFGRPRLAILPIGAYEPRWFMRDGHVDPDESVQIFRDCEADYALAHHWGTFRLTAEPIDEPPRRLRAALRREGLDVERFRIQRPGEVFDVPRRP